jgi:uncharacterized protein (DUF983 family)
MLTCPSCGNGSINPWRKLVMGGWLTPTCPSCKSEITVPPYDAAVLLLIVMLNHFFKPPLIYVCVALVAYGLFRQKYVPLVVKQTAPKSGGEDDPK